MENMNIVGSELGHQASVPRQSCSSDHSDGTDDLGHQTGTDWLGGQQGLAWDVWGGSLGLPWTGLPQAWVLEKFGDVKSYGGTWWTSQGRADTRINTHGSWVNSNDRITSLKSIFKYSMDAHVSIAALTFLTVGPCHCTLFKSVSTAMINSVYQHYGARNAVLRKVLRYFWIVFVILSPEEINIWLRNQNKVEINSSLQIYITQYAEDQKRPSLAEWGSLTSWDTCACSPPLGTGAPCSQASRLWA